MYNSLCGCVSFSLRYMGLDLLGQLVRLYLTLKAPTVLGTVTVHFAFIFFSLSLSIVKITREDIINIIYFSVILTREPHLVLTSWSSCFIFFGARSPGMSHPIIPSRSTSFLTWYVRWRKFKEWTQGCLCLQTPGHWGVLDLCRQLLH